MNFWALFIGACSNLGFDELIGRLMDIFQFHPILPRLMFSYERQERIQETRDELSRRGIDQDSLEIDFLVVYFREE